MDGIQVISPEAEWAAKKLATMDPAIKREFTKAMKAEAAPVGEKVLDAFGTAMPHRGGLAERIRGQGQATVQTSLRSASIFLVLKNRGMHMQAFEKGQVRHPVFGRWLRDQQPQQVPADTGFKTMQAEIPALAEKAAQAVTNTVWKELGR